MVPQGVLDRPSIEAESGNIHPDRINQVNNTISGSCSSQNNDFESGQASTVREETREFLRKSQQERKELRRKPDPLTRIRSGKIPAKPLTKKQRNRLQAITKDTLAKYLETRK